MDRKTCVSAAIFNQGIGQGLAAANVMSTQAAPPDTFAGILARIEALSKKAAEVRGHANDVRERICGALPHINMANEKHADQPANGLIEEIRLALGELDVHLHVADASLEEVWSTLG